MDPVGACKGSVMSSVHIIPIMKICERMSCFGSVPLSPRQLGALRRQVPVPRQAAAVGGMPGRDAVVKARR